MKTFNVWLVLEETEDDSPQNQLETYQMAVVKTEPEGRAIFEEAQEKLEEVKNNLPYEFTYLDKIYIRKTGNFRIS